MSHGGKRKGAGRKPKIQELELIEKLDNIINEEEAINKLYDLIKDNNFNALKLYLEYRFGKPKDKLDVTTKVESLNYTPEERENRIQELLHEYRDNKRT